ncbi:DUF2442 domain-containing protein [uncultured Duncaniella sp.]|uniref:DUF2442 domain-containing protein n=1 Tax=uncultured Duncaniella sp. TaxID=2768039 RepID=UPI00339D9B71
MCRIPNFNVGIKSLDFVSRRGKMAVKLSDGREVIVPLSMFPDIKRLPLKERQKWMVLDDQFFTFAHLSKVFSIQELFRI